MRRVMRPVNVYEEPPRLLLLAIATLAILIACLAMLTGCAYSPPRSVRYQQPFRPIVVIEQPAVPATISTPEN